MIGTKYVGMDVGFFDTFYKLVCDEKIINTPTDVSVACMGELVPIGIRIFRMEVKAAKGVYIAGGNNFVYPRAFLW